MGEYREWIKKEKTKTAKKNDRKWMAWYCILYSLLLHNSVQIHAIFFPLWIPQQTSFILCFRNIYCNTHTHIYMYTFQYNDRKNILQLFRCFIQGCVSFCLVFLHLFIWYVLYFVRPFILNSRFAIDARATMNICVYVYELYTILILYF